MPRDGISVGDLKGILIAKKKSEDYRLEQYRLKILAETGLDVFEEKQDATIKTEGTEIHSEFLARRLIDQNDDLLSTEKDFDDLYLKIGKNCFSEEIFNRFKKSPEYEKSKKSMFDKFIKLKDLIITLVQDKYDDYWKWIDLAVELAKENEMPVGNFIMSDYGYYKITKRYYSKEEFIKYRTKSLETVYNLETTRNIDNLTDAVINTITAERRQENTEKIRQEIKKDIMLEIKKLREVWEKIIEEEIQKIYG